MKPVYWLLIFVIALLLNNVLLLNFVGYFDKDSGDIAASRSPSKSTIVPQAEPREVVEEALSNTPALTQEEPQMPVQNLSDERFVESFQRVADSTAFAEVMDQWQLQSQKRYQDIQRKLVGMNEEELYELAVNSEQLYERQSAYMKLIQGSVGKLSAQQLKDLYNHEGVGSWGKGPVITALLDKGDPQGLAWAKQLLQDGDSNAYYGGDLLNRVYEEDPEFVARHIQNTDLDNRSGLYGLVSLLRQEPDLADSFMKENFDRFLQSDNRWVDELGLSHIDFELSDDHQQTLLSMMTEENRQKRKFSLGFVHRIKDIDGLRSTFSSLQNDRDKKLFITTLATMKANSERKRLAQELARETGDESLIEAVR